MKGVSDLYGLFLGTGKNLVSLGAGSKPGVADSKDLGGGQANSLERSDCKVPCRLHSGITHYITGTGNHSQFSYRKSPNGRVF